MLPALLSMNVATSFFKYGSNLEGHCFYSIQLWLKKGINLCKAEHKFAFFLSTLKTHSDQHSFFLVF